MRSNGSILWAHFCFFTEGVFVYIESLKDTAHDALDKAVDDCYGKTRFTSDAKRVAFLFELYDGLVKREKEVSLKKKK